MVKFLITGSRKIENYAKARALIWSVLNGEVRAEDTIIEGGAMGVDAVAKLWANEFKVRVETFLPIDKTNKTNYLMRNAEMIGACDRVIAFWDGESKGTKFTIDYAKARNKLLGVFMLNDNNYSVKPVSQTLLSKNGETFK